MSSRDNRDHRYPLRDDEPVFVDSSANVIDLPWSRAFVSPSHLNESSSRSGYSAYGYNTLQSATPPSGGGYPDYPEGIDLQYAIAPSSKQGQPMSQKPSRDPVSIDEKPYICLYFGCAFRAAREYDLMRHMKKHYPPPPEEMFDCPGKNCTRVGINGFKRKDHMNEHIAKYHNVYVDGKKVVTIKNKEKAGTK